MIKFQYKRDGERGCLLKLDSFKKNNPKIKLWSQITANS